MATILPLLCHASTSLYFPVWPPAAGTQTLSCVCRMSCCVAGNCDLEVQESHVKETLELLGERLGHPQPQVDWAPFVPHTHSLSYIEVALRHGGTCFHCAAGKRHFVCALLSLLAATQTVIQCGLSCMCMCVCVWHSWMRSVRRTRACDSW